MIPIVKPYIPPQEELMPLLEEVLYSGYIAQGEKVEEFERKLRAYLGVEHLLTLNSGTAALHIALTLLGISEGDEVISTVVTAEPTNTTIALTGASIVWADVERTTGLICPSSIEKRITPKTKAIVIVHYAGMVADMDRVYAVSEKYNIPIIEDCAHAFGAEYKKEKLGFYSDFAIYSFQAIKHLTTVDGGLLVLKSKDYYKRAKKLRWFGLDKSISRESNNITEAGYKYHMNDVNATIGICQMNHIESNVNEYISNGIYFDQHILNPSINKMVYTKDSAPAYWLYTFLVNNPSRFIKYANENGIVASQLHKRNDKHTIFKSDIELLGVDYFYNHFVHIGCGSWVTKERERVCEIINQYDDPFI